jgi:hypothetical protein
MMVYFMHCLKNNNNLYAAMVFFLFSANLNAFEEEKSIEIKDFYFEKKEDSISIGFIQKITLSETIKSAINKGIPFDFKVVCKVLKRNNFWFDQKIQNFENSFSIKYKTLKQVYEIKDINNKKKEFNDLGEAIKTLNKVKDLDLNITTSPHIEDHYIVIKVKLDKKKLPKPLQVNFFDKSWNIESRKYEYWLGGLN